MNRATALSSFVATLATLSCLALPQRALAANGPGDVVVAADMSLALSASPEVIHTGVGFAGRLGYRIRVPLIALTPELGLGYHAFNGDTRGTGLLRAVGGLRAAVGEFIKPSLFGHIGFASATGYGRYSGVTVDIGGALDFTALPILDVGIHAAYVATSDASSLVGAARWVDLGGHVAIYF